MKHRKSSEVKLAYNTKYYALHKTEIAEHQRQYRALHKTKAAERKRQYYALDKTEIAERQRQYRARKKQEKLAAQNTQKLQKQHQLTDKHLPNNEQLLNNNSERDFNGRNIESAELFNGINQHHQCSYLQLSQAEHLNSSQVQSQLLANDYDELEQVDKAFCVAFKNISRKSLPPMPTTLQEAHANSVWSSVFTTEPTAFGNSHAHISGTINPCDTGVPDNCTPTIPASFVNAASASRADITQQLFQRG